MKKKVRILYYFLLIPLILFILQLIAYVRQVRMQTFNGYWNILIYFLYALFGAVIGLVGLLSCIGQKGRWKMDWTQLIVAFIFIAVSILIITTHNPYLLQPDLALHLIILCGYLIISSFCKKQVEEPLTQEAPKTENKETSE